MACEGGAEKDGTYKPRVMFAFTNSAKPYFLLCLNFTLVYIWVDTQKF